jgi:hypothetical protein
MGGIHFSLFSLTDETWVYLGFEYGNLFDTYWKEQRVSTYMGSPGFDFGFYRFFNSKNNIGLFMHDWFAIPVKGFKEINNVSTDINFDEFYFQVGMIVGPGFKYNLSEDFAFKYAVGLSFLLSFFDYKDYLPTYGDVLYSTIRCDWGIGTDVGFRGNITKTFFLNFGSIFTIDFLRTIRMRTSFDKISIGIAKGFFMFSARPYITVGFNIIREY